MVLPALFLPLAVRFGFTDEKLVALLVMPVSYTHLDVYKRQPQPKKQRYDFDF